MTKPKIYFKGAFEYLGGLAAKNSLNDPDQTVKKILDDKRVQDTFNMTTKLSK